ncbi:MAG: amidohydrolase, partial [Dehalococcoidia bacterium]
VSPSAVANVQDIVELVRQRAREVPEGEWIQGFGYRQEHLTEGRPPRHWELDAAAPNHPVTLGHQSGHIIVVNSLALKLAGITVNTPDMFDGQHGLIVKDPTSGEPNGELREAACSRVRRLLPAPGIDELITSAHETLLRYAAEGITTVHDAAVRLPDAAIAYQRAAAEGKLPIRIVMMFAGESLPGVTRGEGGDVGLRTGFGNDRLKVGSVKLWADGSIQGYSGALTEDYFTDPGNRGILQYDPEELNSRVMRLHEAGFQIAIHGNGDRAIDCILDAYEAALKTHPNADHRHRIEHCQMVRDDQLERMASLGVLASFFAKHVYYWGDEHRDIFIGPERGSRISPLRSARSRGVRFGLHSDNAVTPVAPLEGIWCAVNRVTSSGKVLGPEQCLTVEEALRAYGLDAAYLGHDEDRLGSIEVGKLADLVVLDRNPFEVDPMDLRNIGIARTIVGGEEIYRASDLETGGRGE